MQMDSQTERLYRVKVNRCLDGPEQEDVVQNVIRIHPVIVVEFRSDRHLATLLALLTMKSLM